jgi:hypothetical protein
MDTRDRRAPAKDGLEPGKAAGRRSASNALREEAERGWAESDRKAAKGRRRTKARARRRGEARERDAEIKSLKGKLAQSERGPGRKGK